MKADKTNVTLLLRTAKGQLDGIIKMVEDDRYCIDVYNQILATQSLLKKVNREIMNAHMTHCVKEAFESGDEDAKINELLYVLEKVTK